MDPQVFRNRTFLTVAVSGMLSFIGLTAMMMYYPIFLQGVKGISVMKSGQILTPFSVVTAFMSVPAGFILAQTKRYKWMYISGYGLVTAVLFGIVLFDSGTPVFVCVLAATLAGLGLGTIPTINTIVVQLAVPKRLLGASMGAIFFSITMGMAIAPAILGPVMNVAYANRLDAMFPAGLKQIADKEAISALGDPKALLSPAAMKALETSFEKMGTSGKEMFSQAVGAIRSSLEAGVRAVFLLGAASMLISFLLILTVPEVSIDAEVEDKKAVKEATAET
jgi:MFS family permease